MDDQVVDLITEDTWVLRQAACKNIDREILKWWELVLHTCWASGPDNCILNSVTEV